MATYKGNDIASPDRLDEDLKLVGRRLNGLENVEEELNLPPSAEPDAVRRPGQKGYMETQPMADKPKALDDPEGFIFDRPPYGNNTRPSERSSGPPSPPARPPKALDDPEGFINDYPPYGNRPRPDRYSQGGMVKHGSSTRVTCSKKG